MTEATEAIEASEAPEVGSAEAYWDYKRARERASDPMLSSQALLLGTEAIVKDAVGTFWQRLSAQIGQDVQHVTLKVHVEQGRYRGIDLALAETCPAAAQTLARGEHKQLVSAIATSLRAIGKGLVLC